MLERYTLSTTRFPSQSFDETGCDYFLFPTPGKKNHITIDIHYSLEHHNRIHTEEVDLLDLKEFNNLPSWYPFFYLPYQIDVKITCTGFYVYMEIIYIDSSPDPEILSPYIYSVENPNTRLLLISCSQGILSSSSFSCYLLLRLLVYMYLSQLMRTFTNYLKCIVISS